MTHPVRDRYKVTLKDIFLWLFRDAFLFALAPRLLYFFALAPVWYWLYQSDLICGYMAVIGYLVTMPPMWVWFAVFALHEAEPEDNPASLGKQYEGWKDIQGPKWAYIFMNAEVGAMGDHTWPGNLPTWFKYLGSNDTSGKFAMWYWLAIRNPINNLQQLIGQRITPDIEIDYAGDKNVESGSEIAAEGWHFVKCKSGGKTTYSFYLVKRWFFNRNKCFRLRVGYKIKPTIDVEKKIRLNDIVGTAFVPTFYKEWGLNDVEEK